MPILPSYVDGQTWDAAKVNPMTRGINMALTECTSTTRPTPIAEGHHIYETDTNRVLVHDGAGWIIVYEPVQTLMPIAFTPFTGYTGATNSLQRCYAQRSMGRCSIVSTFQFASNPSSVSTAFGFNLPYAAAARGPAPGTTWPDANFNVMFFDADGGRSLGTCVFTSASFAVLLALSASGPYLTPVNVGGTVPFTWAANDRVTVTGNYEMDSPYS